MSEVTRYDKLNLDNINYEKPENQSNVYFGPMYYDLNPLLIQSSRLKVKEIKEDGKQKYLVVETDSKDFSFYDKLLQLDDHNLDQTYQKSEQWFNKTLPMDILETMYKRITKPFNKDCIPIIEFKLPFYKDSLQTKIYNQGNKESDISCLKPGSIIILMLHVRGLKFLKQNYYCDSLLSQIKLIRDPELLQNQGCLIDDDGNIDIQNQDTQYDYEIVDDEILQKNKEIQELEQSILSSKKNIETQQNELLQLEEKLRNLK